jgi:hypothetical protein
MEHDETQTIEDDATQPMENDEETQPTTETVSEDTTVSDTTSKPTEEKPKSDEEDISKNVADCEEQGVPMLTGFFKCSD